MKEYPSQIFLKECFDYDKTSGLLYWKTKRPLTHFLNETTCKKWHTCNAGNIAGRILKENDTLSYRSVKLQGKSYYVHVIIWIMEYGYRPVLIDHIDGDGLNNMLNNLRETSSNHNSRKQKINVNNKSGIKGVRVTENGKFQVSAAFYGKQVYFGRYNNIDYAGRIYSTVVQIISGENFNKHIPFDPNTNEYKKIVDKLNKYK